MGWKETIKRTICLHSGALTANLQLEMFHPACNVFQYNAMKCTKGSTDRGIRVQAEPVATFSKDQFGTLLFNINVTDIVSQDSLEIIKPLLN